MCFKTSLSVLDLVKEIVPLQIKHHAEAEACDLLMEVEELHLIKKFLDKQASFFIAIGKFEHGARFEFRDYVVVTDKFRNSE